MISTLFGCVSWQIWLGIFIGIIIMVWIFFRDREYRNSKNHPKKHKKHNRKHQASEEKEVAAVATELHSDATNNTKVDIADVVKLSEILSGSLSNVAGSNSNSEYIDITPKVPEVIIPSYVNENARTSKKEEMCREILERIYKKKFYNSKPSWLRNPETNRILELDCYNADLKLALECNGIQHYVWPNFTKQTRAEFEAQVRRDNFKVGMCDRYGVYLITVPYNIPNNQLEKYIRHYLPQEI